MALFPRHHRRRTSHAGASPFAETEKTMKQHTMYNADKGGPKWNPPHSVRWNSTDSDGGGGISGSNTSDSLATQAKILPAGIKRWMSWSQPKPTLRLSSSRLLWCLWTRGAVIPIIVIIYEELPLVAFNYSILELVGATSAFCPALLSASVGG